MSNTVPTFTQEQITQVLDWLHVYDWTLQQPEDRELGQSRTNTLDPFCVYLSEMLEHHSHWAIGPYRIEHINTGGYFKRPAWVDAAMKKMDEQEQVITARQFKAILEDVKV